ncbi:hypothetical protein COCON_G00103100 [Conger conger]|uniref:Uncharacterized protein n=1 Tax=Conger conger TaxID=82655 RepID=A0A9Q1HXK6_CONCO|nr:hypothetical protein COCON_G00103100 [Conger conger]
MRLKKNGSYTVNRAASFAAHRRIQRRTFRTPGTPAAEGQRSGLRRGRRRVPCQRSATSPAPQRVPSSARVARKGRRVAPLSPQRRVPNACMGVLVCCDCFFYRVDLGQALHAVPERLLLVFSRSLAPLQSAANLQEGCCSDANSGGEGTLGAHGPLQPHPLLRDEAMRSRGLRSPFWHRRAGNEGGRREPQAQ